MQQRGKKRMDTRRKCIIASYIIFLVVIIPALESAIVFAEDPQIPTRTKVTEIEIYPPTTDLLTSSVVPETIAGSDIVMESGRFSNRLNDCSGLFDAGESGCCINPNDTLEHNCKLVGDDVSEEGTYQAKIKYGYKIPRKNAVTADDKDDIRTSVLFTAHSVNWDANKDQCIKKMGNNDPEINWYESVNAGNNCCGDDPVDKNDQNDCGLLKKSIVDGVTTDTLCLNHEDNPKPGSKEGEWQWSNADDELNSIKYNSCGDFEALAQRKDDGNLKWVGCGEASTSSVYNEEEFRYSVYRQITDTDTGSKIPVKNTILIYLPVQADGYGNLEFLLLQNFLKNHGYNVLLFDRLTSPTPNKLNEIDLPFYSQLWIPNAERLDHTLLPEEIAALRNYRNLGGSILLASGTYFDEPYVSFSPPSYNQRSDVSRTGFSTAGVVAGAYLAVAIGIIAVAMYNGATIGAAIGSVIPGLGTAIGLIIGLIIGLVVGVLVATIKTWGAKVSKWFRKVFGKRKKRPKPHTYYIQYRYISIVNQISKDLNLGVEFNKKNVELADNEKSAPSSFGDVRHPVWNNVQDGIYMNSRAATLKKLNEDDYTVKIIGQQETAGGLINFLATRQDELGKVLFDTDLVKYMFAIGDEPKVGDTDTFILNVANWLEDRSRGPFTINSSFPVITLNAPDKKFKPSAGDYILESNNPNVELKFRTSAGEKDSVTSADGEVDIIAKLKPFLAGSAFDGERFFGTPIRLMQDDADPTDPLAPIHQVLCKGNNGIGSIVECCGAKPCFTHPDNTEIAQKKLGDSVSLYLKNSDFDLVDGNNKANIHYWHNSTLPIAELKRPRRKVKSEVKIESINTGGKDAYATNNVLYMNYSGGKANDYPGIYVYSDIFRVPQTLNRKIDVSFYYKTVLSKINSVKIKAEIFWYADKNNNLVDINNPPKDPLPTVLKEIIDNSDWNKFSINVGVPANFDYGRIVLSVEQYDKGGTGTAYFDKFTLGERYYCVPDIAGLEDDTIWENNLDASNKKSCENAGDKEFGKGFTWTGDHCCGDKANEFYTDDGYSKEAGCWNSTKVTNGSLVQDDNRVLNFNGKFYSCNVDAGDRLFTDVKNTDYITPTPLIEATDADENVKLCTTFNSRNNIGIAQGYYCSPNGANGKSIWKNDAVKDTKVLGAERVAYKRTKLSSTAQSMFALVKNECCPQNTCWNGTECMHDQTGMPWERPSYNYRCVENETGSVDWRVPVKKISWDGMQEGYCPTESYCLVPNANINSIKCIKSQEYIGNHYCDDGQWSTRTRLVAEALLNYTLDNSPDDFTLYCDEYKNALPDIKSNPEYVGDQQATAEVFLTKAGATHVCVLETGDGKKLVGTAADVPIDAELNFGSAAQSSQSSAAKKFQFISLFSPNPDACKNIILNSNEFTKCTGDTSSGAINRNIWVNNKTKLVIFSNKDITLNPKPTALSILEFLVNPLQATISFIRNILRPKIIVANINLDIIKKPKDFTRFYFAKYKKDGKDLMIRSVIETQRDKDSLLAEYEGYSTDICQRAIEAYDDKRVNKDINDPLAITDDIQCYPAINTSDSANSKIIYKVVMQKDSREGIPTKFWQDLTGKIRPKQYAASDASQSNLPVPNAEILLPLALYRVSELMQQGLRLTSGKNTDAVSYYWNLDTHEDYAGIFGSAGELQYNKTFMLSDLYANPKRVSGNYNISLIVIGRDGKFSFTSKQVNFESVLGTGIQQGCKKKLGDANNDNKVDLTDYPLLRAIAKSCIETYNKPLTQGAVVSGEGYDLMNETCVCADMDQKEGLQYGSPTTAYDVDPQTDPTKQDENEFVEVCGNQICDADDDGFIDQPNIDNCVDVSNHDQRDTDHARDYELKNADQIDLGAGIPKLLKIERSIGDACDNCTDTDHDGFGNPGFKISGCELNQTEYDNCQDNKFNPLQEDMDNDDIGDACDDDIDGDGKNNQEDGAIIYRDCSLENSKKCSVFQEFKSESGCCEKRNMFLQADAELKNSCMQNEVAVLCLSGELNAHGATVLPATAAPNTCPAGYKPICYPKTPVTGLTSNTCNTQNSTVALNLSDAPNNMNAHAASKLLQSLDARRNISTSISGKSVDLGSRKKIVKVKANVCGKKIWSGSVNTPWTDSVKWKIQLFNPSNIAAADGYKELSLTHTSGSCQDITFDFGAGVDAEKIGISYDYTPAETCWDRIQNNQETFIDCGGPNCNACVCDWYFCRPWFYTGREPEAGWANFGCEGKGCKGRGPGLTCIADMDIPRDHTLSPTSPISVAWYADYNFRFGTFANPIPEKQYNTAYTKYEYCGKAPGVNVILESEPYLSLTSYEEEVGSILTGQSIGYNTPVCVQSELGNMTCTYAERCMANEFCLVTLSPGTNNLHLAECDSSEDSKAYSQKVCCTLGNEMRKTCLTRANQETPCTRKCGNGIRESPENDEGVNEDCDGKDLGGKTQCNQLDPEYVAGDLKCTSGCTYDTAGCFDQEQYDKAQALPTSPKCGNGVVDTQFGEECDGRDLQSKIFCTDLNKGGRKIYETGKLSCIRPGESNACKYNTINCRGSCGNNKIDANEKCDPTVNPVLDYTCYNYSTITPLIRTFGMITRCSALCEYDTSHCNPVIPDQDTDRKCVPDGKLQWWNGEQCDPLLTPIDTTCEEQGYGAGTLGCNSDCGYEFASCGANLGNTCGNGNVETHEDCDKGADLTAGTEDDVFRTDKLIPIKERRQVHAINPDGTLKTDPYGSPIWTDEWVVTGTQRVPETCVDHDYGTGELGCNNDCTINIEGCDDSSLLCGNRIIDSAEDCDPSAVPEFTTDKDSCSEIGLGFTGGELRCTNRCEYDPTKCT